MQIYQVLGLRNWYFKNPDATSTSFRFHVYVIENVEETSLN